ncbi:asparagine synthase-related protein [uncultured Paraglaciecola sp.]|uniref:asparagine synthase-related protein n=1 Tax=uncultured Paraglaciecola sp. TaxID=1765024 RepID=UPI00261B1258|nr:asparagine synthase-related protein [uncultured Paraglaciecola sp.]
MSIFAGVICLNNPTLKRIITDEVRTNFKDECGTKDIFQHSEDSIFFTSYALFESNIRSSKKSTDIINGNPLFENDFADKSCLEQRLFETLRSARGVFSGLIYDKSNDKTSIFTDKMGIRPVYYYHGNGVFIFSSLLSVIQKISVIDKSLDSLGIIEMLAFGYCLSNRTQFENIKRLDGAEILHFEKDEISSQYYWDWKNIPINEKVTVQDINDLYDCFDDAIQLRLDNSEEAISFLSGGLDSRVIASKVKQYVKKLHTFNFSTSRSQDNEYARLFAESAKLNHNEKTFETLAFPNWTQLIADCVQEPNYGISNNVDKSNIWSGDGGSVAVGHVYITQDILNALKNDDFTLAAKIFQTHTQTFVPEKFLTNNFNKTANLKLTESIIREMAPNQNDSGKAIYYFLMNNDQKRHLHIHFETMGQHKTELHLPFFDSVFLEKIHKIHSRDMLNHKLYMQWFQNFHPSSRTTPWQTYPGHEPCPIKVENNLTYQWTKAKNKKWHLTEILEIFQLLRNKKVFNFFDKKKVYAAFILHTLKLKNYSYLFGKIAFLGKVLKE